MPSIKDDIVIGGGVWNKWNKINKQCFVQFLPDKKQVWFYFLSELCLVLDLRSGKWYKFKFANKEIAKGFFSSGNQLVVREHGNYYLSSYPSGNYTRSKSVVRTKKFLNVSKLKKVRTRSTFVRMKLYRETWKNRIGMTLPIELEHNSEGIYVLMHGFKGSIEIEIEDAEKLDFFELFFR
jgi:hypothetical protein